MSELPWPLPSSWRWATLRDLASAEPNAITDGPFGSNLKTEHYTTTGPRVIRLQNIGDGSFNDERAHIEKEHFESLRRHHVVAGDIVVAALGETLPRACVVPARLGPALVKADCIRFSPSAALDSRFLSFGLNSPGVRRHVTRNVHGVGRPRLNLGEVKEIPLPVAPEPEQRRIVAEIEQQFTRLDAGVAALSRVRVQLKRYRASVLKAACEGRLVPGEAALSRCLGHAFESADTLLLRHGIPVVEDERVPAGWAACRLRDLAFLKGGITKGQQRKGDAVLLSVPYLRVANVQRGYLDLREMKEIVATKEEVADLALQPGDVLFNEGGDRDKLGRGWVWRGELPLCIHQNHVFRARIRHGVLDPRFLSWYGNTFGQEYFTKHGKQTTNLASINMTMLGSLTVHVPPLAEQQRIVAEIERRLSVVDELERLVEKNLTRAAKLRQAILKRAFEGRLVPQDPSDEPASVLLDRIRAERAARDAAVASGRAEKRSPRVPARRPATKK